MHRCLLVFGVVLTVTNSAISFEPPRAAQLTTWSDTLMRPSMELRANSRGPQRLRRRSLRARSAGLLREAGRTSDIIRLKRDPEGKYLQIPDFRPPGDRNVTESSILTANQNSVHSCTALVYYETDAFVSQAAQAVKAILEMQLADDNGRVHVRLIDWIKFNGAAPMVSQGNYEKTYDKYAPIYASSAHCVVIVESPPVFDEGTLGVAYECSYCQYENRPNVAFVTNDNHDSLTFVTIAHEIGHLLCGTHTQYGIMDDVIASNPNYDTFSDASSEEISQELENSEYGGTHCMAEFNGTTMVPHTEYVCDSEGYCYRRRHDHTDGALLFLGLFFIYFFLIGLLIWWPYEYVYSGYVIVDGEGKQ